MGCSNSYDDDLETTEDASFKLNLYFEYVDANGENILKTILPPPTGITLTLNSSCQLKRDDGQGYEVIKIVPVNPLIPYWVNLRTDATTSYNRMIKTRFLIDFSKALRSEQKDVVEVEWESARPSARTLLPEDGKINKIWLNGEEIQYAVKTEQQLKVISIPIR